MAKKFNYKLPSMVALTLFGTAFTAHQANAAEQPLRISLIIKMY